MEAEIERVLLRREQIAARVRSMAAEIADVYAPLDGGLTLVPILSGAIIFLADLIRELPLKLKIAVVQVSTYPGASTKPGDPRVLIELNGHLRGRHVLIVDDILDTGRTLQCVQARLAAESPASIRTAVLLRKPNADAALADFVGFDIEDRFVVGYGLDYDDHYRNYPHIGVLRGELL